VIVLGACARCVRARRFIARGSDRTFCARDARVGLHALVLCANDGIARSVHSVWIVARGVVGPRGAGRAHVGLDVIVHGARLFTPPTRRTVVRVSPGYDLVLRGPCCVSDEHVLSVGDLGGGPGAPDDLAIRAVENRIGEHAVHVRHRAHVPFREILVERVGSMEHVVHLRD